MQIQDVFRYFENDLKQVEEHMERYLRSDVRLIPEIIHHLIGSGGKRFRPLLLLAAAELCGYKGDRRFFQTKVVCPLNLPPIIFYDGFHPANASHLHPSSAGSLRSPFGGASSV